MITRGPLATAASALFAALLLLGLPGRPWPAGQGPLPVRDDPSSLVVGVGIPWAVSLGDLNGDGPLDAATANEASDTISMLLARPEGGLDLPVIHSVAESPHSAALRHGPEASVSTYLPAIAGARQS